MIEHLTAVIKTFERPAAVRRCVRCLRFRYPTLKIIVIDDSRKAAPVSDVSYIHTEYDLGIARGRNRGVSLVQTQYLLLLDDDYFISADSDLESAMLQIERGDVDILGPSKAYIFSRCGGTLYISPKPFAGERLQRCDVVNNSFLARTEIFQRVKWREELKINEHAAFFLDAEKAGLKVAACNLFSFVHAHSWGGAFYKKMRRRSFKHLYERVYGIKRVMWRPPPS